jgi:hypothetical protein
MVIKCADKYAVREYVAQCGCADTLNPLLNVYDSVEDIVESDLPDRFALKLNYGCTYNIICADKTQFNFYEAKKKLRKWMKTNYYLTHSEMQYKDVKRKILLEQFIEGSDGRFPDDYKFYCFNGEPQYLLFCTDRNVAHAQKTFYDIDGNIVNWRPDCISKKFERPESYQEMIEVCKKLSEGFPFVRVDLYDLNGKVIFGELTFTPAGGQGKYTKEGSIELGNLIVL